MPLPTHLIDKPVLWTPNPGPQTWVLQKTEKEILYGGARGGGKTDAGIVWLSEHYQNPNYRGLVLRRNAVDLSDWLKRAKLLYRQLGARYVNSEFVFPSGATISTGHLADEDAFEKYQGHEYQRILIEELTHIPTLELYLSILGSNRSKYPDLPAQFMGTTNPGGPGHRWVKARFIDTCAFENREYTDRDGIAHTVLTGKRYTDEHNLSRVFVQAKVEDNPYLFKLDPNYVAYLESLPDDMKRAWRHGDWDVYEVKGSYYTSELRQARNTGHIGKVPHDPRHYVYTYWDIGNPENTAVIFAQQVEKAWHIIDFYVGVEGQGGLPHFAEVLQEKSRTLGYKYGGHYGPHDLGALEFGSGRTRIEVARTLGINFELVTRQSLDDGIEAVRTVFPTLYIDEEKCQYLLDALQNYRRKWNNRLGQFEPLPEHDWASHPADALRYFATSNTKVRPYTSVLARSKQLQAKNSDVPFDKYKLFR